VCQMGSSGVGAVMASRTNPLLRPMVVESRRRVIAEGLLPGPGRSQMGERRVRVKEMDCEDEVPAPWPSANGRQSPRPVPLWERRFPSEATDQRAGGRDGIWTMPRAVFPSGVLPDPDNWLQKPYIRHPRRGAAGWATRKTGRNPSPDTRWCRRKALTRGRADRELQETDFAIAKSPVKVARDFCLGYKPPRHCCKEDPKAVALRFSKGHWSGRL
jgi:hypothetical protein